MSLYNIAIGACRLFYKTFYKVTVVGLENIPKNTPYVICPNHKSNLDPPLLGAFLPVKVNFMAKAELFKMKPLGTFFSALGAFPVRRGLIDSSAIKKSIQLLKSGETVAIFPEGKRSKKNGMLEKGKRGAALVAYKADALLLPVGIETTYKFRSDIKIRIGESINISTEYPEGLSSNSLQEITDNKLMPSISALSGAELYEG